MRTLIIVMFFCYNIVFGSHDLEIPEHTFFVDNVEDCMSYIEIFSSDKVTCYIKEKIPKYLLIDFEEPEDITVEFIPGETK